MDRGAGILYVLWNTARFGQTAQVMVASGVCAPRSCAAQLAYAVELASD
jgi:hypothetical protein